MQTKLEPRLLRGTTPNALLTTESSGEPGFYLIKEPASRPESHSGAAAPLRPPCHGNGSQSKTPASAYDKSVAPSTRGLHGSTAKKRAQVDDSLGSLPLLGLSGKRTRRAPFRALSQARLHRARGRRWAQPKAVPGRSPSPPRHGPVGPPTATARQPPRSVALSWVKCNPGEKNKIKKATEVTALGP